MAAETSSPTPSGSKPATRLSDGPASAHVEGRQPGAPVRPAAHQWPDVHAVSLGDLGSVIARGVADFRAAPVYGLVGGGLFAAAGWLLTALLFYFELPFFAYPLAMGFALIAPFAAIWFYAISARLEAGEPLSFGAIWSGVVEAAKRDVRWMALVTGFALVIWMDIAAFLFFGLMGFTDFGPDFFQRLVTTTEGLTFLVLGNVIGAAIALFVFSIAVISFPMLYDRDVDFVTAMVTSVRLVKHNPVSMVAWCALIGITTVVSIATGFVGLLVVLPIVGHASWHLYRVGVAPEAVKAGAGA